MDSNDRDQYQSSSVVGAMRGFAAYHPAVQMVFFVGAVVLTILVSYPAAQVASIVLAALYYSLIRGRAAFKVLVGLIPVLLVLAVINPLFNTQGQTVLFSWIAGRPYTLEALVYGFSTAFMFVSVLLWFFCYNHVMTSEKFTYLFARLAPSLTLLFTMVLRLVPTYQRKTRELSTARACIGHSIDQGSLKERTLAGTSLLSALVTWALEGSIVTADSMRSRGYGTAKRTTFARYRITVRDVVALAIMAVLAAAAIVVVLLGAEATTYFPAVELPVLSLAGIAGLICFVGFLAIPVVIDIWEAASWRISLSKI